jgi:hypothetical protein
VVSESNLKTEKQMKKTEILTEELTQEEILILEDNAKLLAEKYNVPRVHIYVGIGENNERIVGYLKEPTYMQKAFCMDKLTTVGMMAAGEEMRSILTLTDENESDPRTYSTASDCDKYRMGMATTCVSLLEIAANAFKKK